MPVKSSGPISFQDIIDEFGGSGSASLSEYYRGGSFVPNTNANINIGVQGQPISLGQFYGARKEIIMAWQIQGAGGSGGNGLANGNGSGSNFAGNRSGVMLKSKYDALIAAGTTNPAITDFYADTESVRAYVEGGAGGGHGQQGAITGGAGSASNYGAGGSGGPANTSAPNPTWGHWGAGGGGGGGDDGSTSYLNLYGSDAAGNAGQGASNGLEQNGELRIDVETDYIVWIGGGGTPAAIYNYRGGPGVPGRIEFTLSTDENTTFTGLASGDGSSITHYTSNTYYNLRLLQTGQVLFYKVEDPEPEINALPINSAWGTTGANEGDTFSTMQIGFQLNPDGTVDRRNQGTTPLILYPTTANISNWMPEGYQTAGIGADYECKFTVTQGDDPLLEQGGSSALYEEWLQLDEAITCYIEDSGRTYNESNVTLEIRKIGETTNDVTQSVRITLNSIPGG